MEEGKEEETEGDEGGSKVSDADEEDGGTARRKTRSVSNKELEQQNKGGRVSKGGRAAKGGRGGGVGQGGKKSGTPQVPPRRNPRRH